MNWSRVLCFFLRENGTQVDIDKGAKFFNSVLAAMQPHTYTWGNTHFQVNCFLGRSIPLENWNNWIRAEDVSRQGKWERN